MRVAELALIDGSVGAVLAPRGRLLLAIRFAIEDDRIVEYDVVADPARLEQLEIALLD